MGKMPISMTHSMSCEPIESGSLQRQYQEPQGATGHWSQPFRNSFQWTGMEAAEIQRMSVSFREKVELSRMWQRLAAVTVLC